MCIRDRASALLGSVLCSALIGVLEAYPPHALRCIFFVGLAGALAAAVMAARSLSLIHI